MILDTCALLYLPSGDRRMSTDTRKRLGAERAVWFCAISAFEIALKYRSGKLELPLKPDRWIAAVAKRYGLTEVPLDVSLCSAAAHLPPLHKDPCDRFIIATAKRLQVPVVTTDERFRHYGVETFC